LTFLAAAVYALCLVGLFLYSLVQLHLAWVHRRMRHPVATPPRVADDRLHRVTVQVPIYNERHVAERIIDCVARFDYPPDKFEIHVLDDSTDDTSEIVASSLARLSARGLQVAHLRRAGREGYKAGALQAALAHATGDFIAIFDADFSPPPDALRKALHYFADDAVGIVQLRWGFLNETYSLLARVQVVPLRNHFVVEQPARAARGFFANFNGSGGVWRRTAIDDAGGWRADTLTEDVDLSYRAQLKGWRLAYLEHERCDGEVPVDMDGVRSQQFRWMKGGAENARLQLFRVLRARLSPAVKIHACAHLLATSMYVLTAALIVSSVALVLANDSVIGAYYTPHSIAFTLVSLMLTAVFYEAQERRGLRGFLSFLPTMLAFQAFTLGMSAHNACAVIRGWLGERTAFVRTPKYGIVGTGGNWSLSGYASRRLSAALWLEAAFLVLVVAGLTAGWRHRDFSGYPIQVPAFVGLLWIIGLSVKHAMQARSRPRKRGEDRVPSQVGAVSQASPSAVD
jgi:cellulose synthase/poly-beta-1,6-N-acetylglucosamine synthase-like glycosyltransferase